jgi:hypothetical protein
MTLKQSDPLDTASTALPTVSSGVRLLGWSSFGFALLQSLCATVVAVNGLRLAIGLGSLVMTVGVGAGIAWFHSNFIRIPMIVIAVLGAIINLAIFFHVRHLRNRAASQWRQTPLTPKKRRMEYLQLSLSLATFLLVAFEEYLHYQFHHHL